MSSPKEVQRVLDLIRVAGPAGQTPTQIAHIVGPPVTGAIVRDLLEVMSVDNSQAAADLIRLARAKGAQHG